MERRRNVVMGEDEAGYGSSGSDDSARATIRRMKRAGIWRGRSWKTSRCSNGLTRKKTATKAENLREGSSPEFLGWAQGQAWTVRAHSGPRLELIMKMTNK
jgi:hypothetical protein